jgi:rRNA processing protein Gar1
MGELRVTGSMPFEQVVPLKGLKVVPKRATIGYLDDVLGNIENR